MGKELVAFASRKGRLTSLKDADSLILYNMDTHNKEEIANPLRKGMGRLEEFFEEKDPSVLFVTSIDEETEYIVEENGVHVIKAGKKSISDLIDELFITGIKDGVKD